MRKSHQMLLYVESIVSTIKDWLAYMVLLAFSLYIYEGIVLHCAFSTEWCFGGCTISYQDIIAKFYPALNFFCPMLEFICAPLSGQCFFIIIIITLLKIGRFWPKLTSILIYWQMAILVDIHAYQNSQVSCWSRKLLLSAICMMWEFKCMKLDEVCKLCRIRTGLEAPWGFQLQGI